MAGSQYVGTELILKMAQIQRAALQKEAERYRLIKFSRTRARQANRILTSVGQLLILIGQRLIAKHDRLSTPVFRRSVRHTTGLVGSKASIALEQVDPCKGSLRIVDGMT